jgi:hypothetical protein
MTLTRTASARFAAVAALSLAGFFGVVAPAVAVPLGTGSAQAQPGNLGPFEYEAQCLSRGNQGMQNGEWDDYDCVGSYGAWYVVPR